MLSSLVVTMTEFALKNPDWLRKLMSAASPWMKFCMNSSGKLRFSFLSMRVTATFSAMSFCVTTVPTLPAPMTQALPGSGLSDAKVLL